jgi:Uncharacterized conserved protein related to C-terminal domain of eukaryotic chaperone, SACSIN
LNAGKADLAALLLKASEKLETARIMYKNARYDDAVSRAYYAAFHAMTAALLSRNLSYSSHGQVIGAFNREFIKTDIFPKNYSAVIQALFDDRQIGDYGIFVKISKSAAREHINKAEKMVEAIRLFLELLEPGLSKTRTSLK